MKKLVKFGIVIIMSIGILIGCSNETNHSDAQTGSESRAYDNRGSEQIDIKLWLDNDDYAEALMEAMEVALPHINFTYEHVGAGSTVDKLALDGPAGLGGDIILLPHDHMADALSQNLLLPLGSEFTEFMEGRILEDGLGSANHEGNYYGIPLSIETVALFYNKTLLDEYGFEVAETFEEIFEQAAVFNKLSENQFIIRYLAGEPYRSHFALTAAGFELFGPNHDDPELINLNTPEVVAGLEFLQALREILPVPIGDLDHDNTHGTFVDGMVPYSITGPWSFGDINTDGDFEWEVTLIPTIKGVQPITFSGNTIGAISSFTDHPDIAREVLEFIASNEGLQIMYENRGSILALQDISVIHGAQAATGVLGILEQAEYSHPMPTIPEIQVYWEAAGSMIEAVWEGLLTSEAAAEKALADFNAALFLAQ